MECMENIKKTFRIRWVSFRCSCCDYRIPAPEELCCGIKNYIEKRKSPGLILICQNCGHLTQYPFSMLPCTISVKG
jgi:hypothetical protein